MKVRTMHISSTICPVIPITVDIFYLTYKSTIDSEKNKAKMVEVFDKGPAM